MYSSVAYPVGWARNTLNVSHEEEYDTPPKDEDTCIYH